MASKKEKFDSSIHKYNPNNDTLSVLMSLIDTSFGPRIYEDLMNDLGGEDHLLRYHPEGWQTMESIRNIRARLNSDSQGHKILELTFHDVAIMGSDSVVEKTADEASKLVNKAVTQLKKKFKEVSGNTLSLETIKHKGGKDYVFSCETVNNPRVETSWISPIVGMQYPRLYYKVSKYYIIKSDDEENVSEEYK